MSPKTPEQNAKIRVDSKQRIMDAAFILIAKNGYEATSIAMIANEAGVSKGLLYNYFNSKEEMVKALLQNAVSESEQLIQGLMDKNPKVTLRNLFEWFFKEIRERHDHWRLLTELTFKIEKFDFVHEVMVSKLEEYIGLLELLFNQMGYKNARNEARLVSAIIDGIGVQALIMRENYPLDDLENYLIEKYCYEN